VIPFNKRNQDIEELLLIVCRFIAPNLSMSAAYDSAEKRIERFMRDQPHGDLLYIGTGQWRLVLVWDDEKVKGCRLVHNDRTPEEIDTVEKAITILGHFTET
jgi:hypothetical protein